MNKTMTLLAASAIAVSAMSPAFAGGNAAPIVEAEPVVIVEEAGSSISPWILILLGIGAAVALSSN